MIKRDKKAITYWSYRVKSICYSDIFVIWRNEITLIIKMLAIIAIKM